MWLRLCPSLVIAGEVYFVHFGKRKLMMFDFHGGDGVWMSCWMGGRKGRSRLVNVWLALWRNSFLKMSIWPICKQNDYGTTQFTINTFRLSEFKEYREKKTNVPEYLLWYRSDWKLSPTLFSLQTTCVNRSRIWCDKELWAINLRALALSARKFIQCTKK